jgi:CheY-like chemotaxis protein
LRDELIHVLHEEEPDVRPNVPPQEPRALGEVGRGDSALAGRRVVLVDDDMRNLFALTALLERGGMEVLTAENGRDAVTLIGSRDDVDLALIDVMMPEMDGYETMTAIRKMAGREAMPLIALTAKAMKGDRERCIDAGASDYIAKPVASAQLLSLLRTWLSR